MDIKNLFIFALSTFGAVTTSSPSSQSRLLICHSDNSSECYPKVFEPTDEFQMVRDDQDLPAGLHIRLNFATGQKEAKINNPNEVVDPSLQGLPVDSSVVVIDGQPRNQEQIRIPAKAPTYDPVGKVKEPVGDGSAAAGFFESLTLLRNGLDIDGALDMLEELSHDIYYGLKIAEDYDTVRKLFCLANLPTANDDMQFAKRRARTAALTIASALQNNPKALAEIETHWPALQTERCAVPASEPLATAAFRLVGSGEKRVRPALHNDPKVAKLRAAAISGLLKSDVIRRDFLANGGIDMLLRVLSRGSLDPADDGDWEPAKRKVGLLVIDNFLDQDMGAAVDEWPAGGTAVSDLGASSCESKDHGSDSMDAGCWEWWAERLSRTHSTDKDHWAMQLLGMLKARRNPETVKGGEDL